MKFAYCKRKGFAVSSALVIVFLFFVTQSAQGYPMLSRLGRMSARSIPTAPLFATTATVNNNNDTTTTTTIPSNQELVSRRMQVARRKRDARKLTAQQVQERNLHYKRMLHDNNDNSTEYPVPSLYAVKVSVCDELRESLRLNGRERRGRVFVEVDSDASRTLKALKQELHSFFRCLKKSTYILHASLPQVNNDGSILSPSFQDDPNTWAIETDEDVIETFQQANDFFSKNDSLLK